MFETGCGERDMLHALSGDVFSLLIGFLTLEQWPDLHRTCRAIRLLLLRALARGSASSLRQLHLDVSSTLTTPCSRFLLSLIPPGRVHTLQLGFWDGWKHGSAEQVSWFASFRTNQHVADVRLLAPAETERSLRAFPSASRTT